MPNLDHKCILVFLQNVFYELSVNEKKVRARFLKGCTAVASSDFILISYILKHKSKIMNILGWGRLPSDPPPPTPPPARHRAPACLPTSILPSIPHPSQPAQLFSPHYRQVASQSDRELCVCTLWGWMAQCFFWRHECSVLLLTDRHTHSLCFSTFPTHFSFTLLWMQACAEKHTHKSTQTATQTLALSASKKCIPHIFFYLLYTSMLLLLVDKVPVLKLICQPNSEYVYMHTGIHYYYWSRIYQTS